MENKDLALELRNIFNGCDSYHNLYDLFDNLVDYDVNENDNRSVENFLNHYKTKEMFEWYEKNIYQSKYYPCTIETPNFVYGNNFTVCLALLYIDSDEYFKLTFLNDKSEFTEEINSFYNMGDIVDYDFQSEEEETAWYEYFDENDSFDDNIWENRKEWLENYRKEKQNER
ncbi:MAG: hypothetical protein J6V33_03205 [Bacteroidales bacterium]|nr:hypothetical protein [Bacteroidales bacterium]